MLLRDILLLDILLRDIFLPDAGLGAGRRGWRGSEVHSGLNVRRSGSFAHWGARFLDLCGPA
jgi:hypothetical protein